MATDTVAAPTKPSFPDPTRHIWQVPLFLLGVSFFVATWQGWLNFGPPSSESMFARDLDALRNNYEMVSFDREKLKDLLAKVAGSADLYPEQAKATHLILGSGYVKLAELTPSIEEAKGYWMLAQQHFERISIDDFEATTDRSKLAFRSAKARAAVGIPNELAADKKKLREYILNLIHTLDLIPFGEDPGEAGRLQADLAMRLTPPELQTARDTLTRYLKETVASPPLARERATVLLGEIHFRRKELDLARKWLETIGSDASAETIASSKALLARVHMAESNWSGATREWEAIKAMPNLPAGIRNLATYNLGVCKLNSRAPDAAAKLFEETAKGEDSPESCAAAFQLADLYLKSADASKRLSAVDLLAKAMKNVANIKDLRDNAYIYANDVDATFKLAFSTLVADGAYEAAMRTVDAYRPIAEGGIDREKRAEILSGWAKELQKSGGDYKSKALEAGKEYLEYSTFQPAVSAKADTLRRAASLYRLAGEPAAAVAALQQATKLPNLPDESAGPIWFDLADALIAADRTEDYWPALNEAMRSGTLTSTIVRYRLAHRFAEARLPEASKLARMLYEQIARQSNVSQAEQEYQELAMIELARELIRVHDFAGAELYLRPQLHTYPNGPQAPLGRLLLGVSLLQIAKVDPPAGPTLAKAEALRNEALQLFQSIVAEADAKQKKIGKLSEGESWLRVQAAIRILQALLYLKNPNELLAESADLVERHRGTVEELIIRSLVYHAFMLKKETPQALVTRDKMKELFDKLPNSAFNGSNEEYTVEYWQKYWLFTREKK